MIPGFSNVNCVLLLCWKLEMILGSLIFLLNHYILGLTHRTRKPLSFCRMLDWNKEWLLGVQGLFHWKDNGNSSHHLIKTSHVKNYLDPDYIGCNWRSWVKVPQQVSGFGILQGESAFDLGCPWLQKPVLLTCYTVLVLSCIFVQSLLAFSFYK